MDHTKTILIVSISVFVLILSVIAGYVSNTGNDVTSTTQTTGATGADTQNAGMQQTQAGENMPVVTPIPTAQEIEYLYDANGCGGKDNTVWCVTSSSCVAPGTCAASTGNVAPAGVAPEGAATSQPVTQAQNQSADS